MKRTFLVIVAVFACVFSLEAQGAPLGDDTFSGRIDLDIGIARLSQIAKDGDLGAMSRISSDTAVLLFGTLSRPVVVSDEPFEAVAEFLEGEWIGTSKIVLHRVYLTFKGESYKDFLDGSTGRRTVVIARDATIRKSADGEGAMYLDVVSLRPIF